MSAKRVRTLKVVVSGTRSYIDVPPGQASDLHRYLRANCIQSSPPEPSASNMDSIELPKGTDVKAVQSLLDKWS